MMKKNPDSDFPADALDRLVQSHVPPAPSPALLGRCLATVPRVTQPVTVHGLKGSRHTPCAVRHVFLRSDDSLNKAVGAMDNAAADGTRSVPATLCRTPRERLPKPMVRDNWRFAEALAVAALVWINLTMSAALSTDYGFRQNTGFESNESIETVAQRIQGLVPELSPEESRRHAILLRASSSLVCLPDLAPMLSGSRDVAQEE